MHREEVLEFAIGGNLADKEDEQIDVEVWDYHWVNRPGNLTWYDEWYRGSGCIRVFPPALNIFNHGRAWLNQFACSSPTSQWVSSSTM